MLSHVLFLTSLALSGSALITPSVVEPRAASITCSKNTPVTGYFIISTGSTTSAWGGWSNNYKLANATKAVGSTVSAGSNPYVVYNAPLFSGPNNQFTFQACASTAMGYPADDTAANGGTPKFYGQIYITIPVGVINYEYRCVTRHYVDYGHEFLTIEPCLTADDTNLTTQYFRVTQTHAEYQGNRWSIQNVGHPKGTSGKIYYWAPGTTAAPAWTVHPETPTAYGLEFREVHIN